MFGVYGVGTVWSSSCISTNNLDKAQMVGPNRRTWKSRPHYGSACGWLKWETSVKRIWSSWIRESTDKFVTFRSTNGLLKWETFLPRIKCHYVSIIFFKFRIVKVRVELFGVEDVATTFWSLTLRQGRHLIAEFRSKRELNILSIYNISDVRKYTDSPGPLKIDKQIGIALVISYLSRIRHAT